METELRLALMQAPVVWEDPVANRKLFGDKIASAAGTSDLIILPEMFTTGFTMSPGNVVKEAGQRTIAWMREQASIANAAICGSMVCAEGDNFYNRLIFISPGGEEFSYDKRHTFTLAGEQKVYTAGNKRQLLTFRGFKICPLICYDLRFPVWSRNTEGYDLLIYVANWPEPRIGAWDTLLKARAIENMSYCAGVNRVGRDNNGHKYPGHSAVYDALGNRQAYSEEDEVLQTSLNLSHLREIRDRFKFLDDRDQFSMEL